MRWINFGGTPGSGVANGDSLIRFKRGWSSGTRTAYFCTKVLNPQDYWQLDADAGGPGGDYFPSYRRGEFL